MSRQERAAAIGWCAGLFDGEGSIGFHAPSLRSRLSLSLRIHMTNEEALRRFAQIVGAGTIRRLPSRDGHRLPSACWQLGARDAIARLLRLLRPHLVVKRREAELASEFLTVAPDGIAARRIWKAMAAGKTKGRALTHHTAPED